MTRVSVSRACRVLLIKGQTPAATLQERLVSIVANAPQADFDLANITILTGGSVINDAARDLAFAASIALPHGVDFNTPRHALMRNGTGTASGPTSCAVRPACGGRLE